jgi:hypothetical protein
MTSGSPKKPASEEEKVALAALDKWLRDNFSLIERVFDEFKRTGSWPVLLELQHDLDTDQGPEAKDIVAIWDSGPRGTTDRGGIHGPLATLSVRVLSQVPSAKPLLDHFIATIKFAMKRYRERATAITSEEICSALGTSPEELELVSTLLFSEWPLQVNRTGIDGQPWVWHLDVGNRRFMGVETLDDFLDIQAKLMWRRTVHPAGVKETLPFLPSDTAPIEPQHRGRLSDSRRWLIGVSVPVVIATASALYGLGIGSTVVDMALLVFCALVVALVIFAWFRS